MQYDYEKGLASKLSLEAEKRLVQAYLDDIELPLIRLRFNVFNSTVIRILKAHKISYRHYKRNKPMGSIRRINWYGF